MLVTQRVGSEVIDASEGGKVLVMAAVMMKMMITLVSEE